MTKLDKITKGMRIVNSILFLPLIFMTFIAVAFAIAGLTMIERDNPNLFDEVGGFGIWWDMLQAYEIILLIFFVSYFFWWDFKRKKKVQAN